MNKTLFKKIFSFILVVTVLMSQAAVFAESNGSDSTVVLEEDIKTAELLYSLGFIKSGEVKAEDYKGTVTRSKFVGYIGEMLGFEENNSDADSYFYDLEEHGIKSIVNRLVGMGVISVNDERKFYPDDAVSKDEVIKVFVAAMGYNLAAQSKGGYPVGYVATAKTIGLDCNISENPTTVEIYKVMASALDIPLMETKAVGPDGAEQIVDETATLLSVYHKIYADEGYVRSVGNLGIDGATAGENNILIGDYNYSLEEYKKLYPENFLGLNVKVYYKEPSKGKKILTVMYDSGKSEVIVLDASNVEQLDNNYVLNYYDAKRDREVDYKIDRGAIVVYNGRELTSNIKSVLSNLTSGYVRLIEGNVGSPYKYVLVNDYTNFVVSHKDETKEILHDKFGSAQINISALKDLRIYDEDMNYVTLSAVNKGDILSVARDADGNASEILISTQFVEGKISSTSQKNGKTILKINDELYNMYAKAGDGAVVEAGLSGKFYLNRFGEIVLIEKAEEAGMRYAILCQMNIEELFDKTLTFRVFEQSGKWNNYIVAEKVYIDGVRKTKVSDILEAIPESSESGLKPQVVRLETNSDNEVIRIDTLATTSSESARNAISKTQLDTAYIGWWGATRTFEFSMLTDKDTVVFYCPSMANIASGNYTEEEFSISTVKELPEYTTTTTPIVGYRADSHTIPEDIIVREGENYSQSWNSKKSNLMVIDEVQSVLDEATLDVKTVLNCFMGEGLQETIEISNDYVDTFNSLNLEKGDAIAADRDPMGRIISVKVIFDKSADEEDPGTRTALGWHSGDRYFDGKNQNFNVFYAYAGNVDGTAVKCFNDKYGDKTVSDLAFFSPNSIIVVEDTNRDTNVYVGTPADIVSAIASETGFSRLLVQYTNYARTTVVVYK